MTQTLRLATLFVAMSFVLTACAGAAAQTTTSPPAVQTAAPPTAVPTAAPTAVPTAIPTLAENVSVAGVDIGGMTLQEARDKLETELKPLLEPIELTAGDTSLTLKPADIGLELPLESLLETAASAKTGDHIDLKIDYDESKIRAALDKLAADAAGSSTPKISVLSSTDPISRSFALEGGAMTLDEDAALKQIAEQIQSIDGERVISMTLQPAATLRPTPKQLQEQIQAMAAEFKGTIGVYVYDLKSGKQVAGLNDKTAFTAASTIKTAILLNAYVNVPEFSAKQKLAIQKMIVESDNLKANDVMAAAAGGTSTESAFEGAEQMSAMMADLGLKNTFLYVPFESTDFIKLYKVKYKTGPKQGGEAPFIPTSNTLRTTPAEMAQLYIWLNECSQGKGVLLDKFSKSLSAERCGEMIDWLLKNGDKKRMMSGLPADAIVAHKSGWIPPVVQGDAGIVRSPGGDFIVSIYIYQPGERYGDKVVQQLIGSFARLVYTYYNPVVGGVKG